MPGLIRGKALGLIETVGLVGAIEACDAAAKAADVIVSAAEVTDAALVTLKIFGELGAVQAAVDAGGNAAMKVGQLLAKHVIPNPDDNLDVIMGGMMVSPERPQPPMKKAPPPAAPDGTKQSVPTEASNLDDMSVVQLRQYARTIPNLAIKGREISRADKITLLKEIRAALKTDLK